MINFRFHIVSLIAVFLALGLGILVGSTVVDQVIVDRLDTEIKSVRHDSSQKDSDNAKLRSENSQLQDFLKKSSNYAIDGRLVSQPVAIVADKGVDAGVVKNLLDTVRAAGAEVPGVVWLDERWNLTTPDDVKALEDATHTTGNATTVRAAALRAVANRLAGPPPAASKRKNARDMLATLDKAGFVSLSDGKPVDLAVFPVRTPRVLLVTGTDSHLAKSTTLDDFVHALVDVGTPTVVAEVYDAHGGAPSDPPRGATLKIVRDDAQLSKQVSTFDDAELPQGDVTAVIALQQVADGTVGQYGYGQGADSTLPPPPS